VRPSQRWSKLPQWHEGCNQFVLHSLRQFVVLCFEPRVERCGPTHQMIMPQRALCAKGHYSISRAAHNQLGNGCPIPDLQHEHSR
jgi:hypothetical protein